MKRSVIQLAGRTLLVSLPSKWADANGVKKGNELEIVEDGHRLIVNTEQKSKIETAELDADALGHLLSRYIHALYKRGIDEIRISYSDPKTADTIRSSLLNEVVGYEIVSQTPKSCDIKLITSGNIAEFDNLLRRIFLLLISMAEECADAIKGKNFEHLSKTALLEETNNRLTTICRRSLNKWGAENFSKVGPIYYIIEDLENLADEYKYLCKGLYGLKNSKPSIRQEVLQVLDKTNEMLRLFYEMFYKFELNKLSQIYEMRKKIVSSSLDLIENKKPSSAEFYILHHSLVILQKIFCMTGPELVLIN
ncbi:AbrB/MazE/SpoVT family DNA-binding domain-containing protein [Candidatus Woesearchaeota archaeon]|nr:AbrB/MazE/SpoVT family DNA-binding domain-containing protein [Candidatus Woesearchaeota archaeon]